MRQPELDITPLCERVEGSEKRECKMLKTPRKYDFVQFYVKLTIVGGGAGGRLGCDVILKGGSYFCDEE